MKKVQIFLSLAGGFLIVLISVYGFFLLRSRPGLPQGIARDNVIQIDQVKIERTKDIEFILSRKSIGESCIIFVKTEGKIEKREVRTIPFYSQAAFPFVYFLIGLFSFLIGFSVFFLRPEEVKARIFYWASLAFSSSLIISGEYYCLRKAWLSFLPGAVFCFLYPLAPALLLDFSLSFSQKRLRYSRFLVYLPALIFGGLMGAAFLYSGSKYSIEVYRFYQSNFYVFRFYVILYVLISISYLISSYRKFYLEEERAQIKWVFFGLVLGLGPFIFLYQLPQILRIKSLLSEEFSAVFFVFIPFAFAVSIIKFKLMNIELVINRSLVYSLLTIFTVSVYVFSTQVFHSFFSKFLSLHETAISVASALLAALAFHPARKKIQTFVDRAFYRQSYDYRKSILHFNEKAQRMINPQHLLEYFQVKVQETLPLEEFRVSIYSGEPNKDEVLYSSGEGRDLVYPTLHDLSSDKITARKRAVLTTENMDFSNESLLEEKRIEIVLPLSFKSTALVGFLFLGRKKSGERFSRDDIELLLAMSAALALNLERIKLQEEVIYERASREKLDELNRLKTEFISTVSHELRTPMSSIQGLAEILQEGKIKKESDREELLRLMAGETNRLTQLIHNILDFGKIEQQAKTYHFEKVKIQLAIEEAVRLFRPSLERSGFILRTHLPENPLFLEIDQDALKQALINIIDNAIKYSAEKKEIDIRLIEKEREVEIQVQDQGIGIPPTERDKIFEKFYRATTATQHNPKGVGLGLKIVKHIMVAHKGEIKVESEMNKGSTFSLVFPKP